VGACQPGGVELLGHRFCVSIPICFLDWGDGRSSHSKYTLNREKKYELDLGLRVKAVAGMHDALVR
jgi:hypothetical protein